MSDFLAGIALPLAAVAFAIVVAAFFHSQPSRHGDEWDQIERSRSVMVAPSPSAHVVAP